MVPQDYASQESFFKKLNAYLLAARHENWINEKTIVVFPEYIGSWLALAGEGNQIFQASTLASAERMLVLRRPFQFLHSLLGSKEKGRAEAAFFRMKARTMAEIYHNAFSALARDYAITIIAGSIVLPAPQILKGRLISSEGPLYNTSVVYQPDGTPNLNLVRKSFPTAQELLFTAPAPAADIPAFDTPSGRLGVLVCADSWFPQTYAPLKEQNIDLLVVPSFAASSTHTWNQPWLGYDGWPPPADVDLNDVEKITEGQAWNKYSLACRIRPSGATYGVNVFLRGKLWDQDAGGWPATLVRGDDIFVEEQTQKAAMLSLWL